MVRLRCTYVNIFGMIRDEAYRGLIGDLPEKFLEKYFTPDVMMELLEEQFLVEDNHSNYRGQREVLPE